MNGATKNQIIKEREITVNAYNLYIVSLQQLCENQYYLPLTNDRTKA